MSEFGFCGGEPLTLKWFLDEFPNGELAGQARRLIDEKKKNWQKFAGIGSLPIYIGLLVALKIAEVQFPKYVSFGNLGDSWWLFYALPAIATVLIVSERQPKRPGTQDTNQALKIQKGQRKAKVKA